jgi:hypothetical protein
MKNSAAKCAEPCNSQLQNHFSELFSRKNRWHCESLIRFMLLGLTLIPVFAAAGWSLIYLLCGGGLGGALLIFVVLKMIGH